MSKAVYARIVEAFDAIYAQGDNGLEFMDGHNAMDIELMDHFYNDTVETLSSADKLRMAEMLETIVADMDFDLESF